jgi:hypothetical protein
VSACQSFKPTLSSMPLTQDAHEALFSTLMCVIGEQQQRNLATHLSHSLFQSAVGVGALYAAAAGEIDLSEPVWGPYAHSPTGSDDATSSDAASVASSAGAPYMALTSTAARRARAILRRRRASSLAGASGSMSSRQSSNRDHFHSLPSASALPKCTHNTSTGASAIPTNPMTGWMLRRTQCVSCPAGQEWECEPFVCLSVSPPWMPGSVPTLSACLRNYFASERISDWRCDLCGHLGCVKACRMARRPPILAIHVQQPIGARVIFPSTLAMDSDCGLGFGKQGSTAAATGGGSGRNGPARRGYTLVSVVQHMGVDGAGHYVAFRREPHIHSEIAQPVALNSPSQWLCADDARVVAVSEKQVLACRPYMLLYLDNACFDAASGTSAVQVQVTQWGRLRELFAELVKPSDCSSRDGGSPGGAFAGKGSASAATAGVLAELEGLLGEGGAGGGKGMLSVGVGGLR